MQDFVSFQAKCTDSSNLLNWRSVTQTEFHRILVIGEGALAVVWKLLPGQFRLGRHYLLGLPFVAPQCTTAH